MSSLTAVILGLPSPFVALANDVQPRLFNNVPVGVNFFSIGISSCDGEVTVDSSLPVADVEGSVDTVLLSYSRGLDLGGRSGLVTVAVPYADTHFDGGRSSAAPRRAR